MRIPFGTLNISAKSKKLIREALSNNRISCGKYVREFEKRFSGLIGTKEAVAVSSGGDAAALAMATLYDFGAKRGDEVIIPALSFVSTGNSVLEAGLAPVFVDIEKETLNINPSKIKKAITRRTKAIMPVHLMGKPAEMDTIRNIARKYSLFVIDDAAEAFGAVYKNKNIGTLGDMAIFSLYIAHVITTGEGGIVVTNRPDFAEILRSLRAHGRACKCKSCILNTASGYCEKRFQYGQNQDIRFQFERIGFSSKMNELEAAIGLGNLDYYHQIIRKRRKNLLYLMNRFGEFNPCLYTVKEESYERIGPHAFPVILGEKAKFTRNKIVYYLEKHGVDTRNLFLSIPTQCGGFKFLGHKYGDFPEAEYIGNNGFHIGIHQDLSKGHLDYFIGLVRKFLQGEKK